MTKQSYISYIDGNDLYGNQIIFNHRTGLFLYVDLEYLKTIHEYHEEFTTAPERYKVKYNEKNLRKRLMDIFRFKP